MGEVYAKNTATIAATNFSLKEGNKLEINIEILYLGSQHHLFLACSYITYRVLLIFNYIFILIKMLLL